MPKRAPIGVDDGVERLIQIAAVAQQRLAQQAFLHGADLLERAVAAAVEDRRARFEAADAHRVEYELEDQLRAVLEDAGAPEGRSERESPLRGVEAVTEIANLEDADRRVVAAHGDREARVGARGALAVRAGDELLEPFYRVRRRRHEPRDLLRRQERVERRRVRRAQ